MRKTLENSAQKAISALSAFLPLFIEKTEEISDTAKKTFTSVAKKAGYWSIVGVVGIILAGAVMQISGVPVLPEVAMAEQGFGYWVAVTIGNLLLWCGLGAGIVCAILAYILQVIIQYPYGEFYQVNGEQVGGYVTVSAVVEGWTIMRDLSLAMIAVAAAVGIFAVILNINNYKWQQILGRLVVVSVLINFSRSFVGLATDLGTVVMATFGNSFGGYFAVGLISGFGLPTLGDFATDFVADQLGVSGVGTVVDNAAVQSLVQSSSWTQIIGAYLMLDIMYIVFIAMLITGIFVLLIAIVGKMLCAVTVPIAMTAAILPATQKFWSSWLNLFQKLMVAPIVMVVGLWLTMIMLFGTGSSVEGGAAIGSQSLTQTTASDPQAGIGAAFNDIDVDQDRAVGGQLNKPNAQFNSLQPNVLMQYMIAVILLGMTFKATASVRNLAPRQLESFIGNTQKTAENLARFPARSFKSLASGLGTAPIQDGSFFGGYDGSQGVLKGALGYAFNRKPVKVLSAGLGLTADAQRTLGVGTSEIARAFKDKDTRYDEKVVSILQSEAALDLVHGDDASGFFTGRDIGGQFNFGNFGRRFLSRSLMIGTSEGHRVAEDFLGPREAIDAGLGFMFGSAGPSIVSQLGMGADVGAGRKRTLARRDIEALEKQNADDRAGKVSMSEVQKAQRDYDELSSKISSMEDDMNSPDMEKDRDVQSMDMQAVFDVQLQSLDDAYRKSREDIRNANESVNAASEAVENAGTDEQRNAAQERLNSAKARLESAQTQSQIIGDDITALNDLRKQNSASLNDIAARDGGSAAIGAAVGSVWATQLNKQGGTFEKLEKQQNGIVDQMAQSSVFMEDGEFSTEGANMLSEAEEQNIKDREDKIRELKQKEIRATKKLEDMMKTTIAGENLITRAEKALREKDHGHDVSLLLNELNDRLNRNDIDGIAEYALAAVQASNIETLQRWAATELGKDLGSQRSGVQGMRLVESVLSKGGMSDPDKAQLLQRIAEGAGGKKKPSLLHSKSIIQNPGSQVPRFSSPEDVIDQSIAVLNGMTETDALRESQGGKGTTEINLLTGLREVTEVSYALLGHVGNALASKENLNGQRLSPELYAAFHDAGEDAMRARNIPENVIAHVMERGKSVDRTAMTKAKEFNEKGATYFLDV